MNLKHSVLLPHADGVHLFHADQNMQAIKGAPFVKRMTSQQQTNASAQIRSHQHSVAVEMAIPQRTMGDTQEGRDYVERILENMDKVQVVDSRSYSVQVTGHQ